MAAPPGPPLVRFMHMCFLCFHHVNSGVNENVTNHLHSGCRGTCRRLQQYQSCGDPLRQMCTTPQKNAPEFGAFSFPLTNDRSTEDIL